MLTFKGGGGVVLHMEGDEPSRCPVCFEVYESKLLTDACMSVSNGDYHRVCVWTHGDEPEVYVHARDST